VNNGADPPGPTGIGAPSGDVAGTIAVLAAGWEEATTSSARRQPRKVVAAGAPGAGAAVVADVSGSPVPPVGIGLAGIISGA
jgi:hypothetical protein